jgi:hypothetical protein
MLDRKIVHLGFDKSAMAQAKREIEKGNLFIGNTHEEYVLIQKIKGKYHLGTYSVVSHDGTNAEMPKAVVDKLFDTILSEEGSDDFFFVDTHGDTDAMKYRVDLVDAILEIKQQYTPKARPKLHLVN